jgi:hypothetical protein
MKKLIWKLLNGSNFGPALQLFIKSELKQNGWFRSFRTKRSVDANGNPIPWYPYSMIDFLENRVNKDLTVFEYGAGNSTLWFANKALNVSSVESDQSWMEILSKKIAPNTTLYYEDVSSLEYVRKAADLNRKFDIIIVDGRRRVECIKNSLEALSDKGVVILDNSDRPTYETGRVLLKEAGFKEIKISGIPPIIPMNSSTSIFYRNGNCLDI